MSEIDYRRSNDIARLRGDIERLEADNARLREHLQERVSSLMTEVQKLQAENARLRDVQMYDRNLIKTLTKGHEIKPSADLEEYYRNHGDK